MKILMFILIGFSIFLVGCNDTSKQSENIGNYNVQKLSTSEKNQKEEFTEEPLASFSTKILQKDSDRQTNITITCNSLNGIIVKAGETFSFCDTLGPAQPEDGYKKANAFDSEGNIIQEYGGGKCQVSTTLYNAVLAGSGLTVVERHKHSGPAEYVAEDMDACVSYGSCDFKFKNDNDFDIKMYFSNTSSSVDVSIVKLI